MSNTDNYMVNAIGKLHIEGNIIPPSWYKFFTFDNGKPDLIAIHILSDIVYWYRPTTRRCEETGEVIGVYKKFKADLLQRSYDSFAEWLGVSKRQVKEAMDRLEKKGVIFREFRSISASIHNVLFIGINVDILATSLLHSNVPPPTFERTTPYVQTHTPLHSNVPPPTFERKTNTEITTENTTKITTESESTPTQPPLADEKTSNSSVKPSGKTSSSAKKPTSSVKQKFDPKTYPLEDTVDYELWCDFVDMRKSIKKPLTKGACKLLVDDFKAWIDEGLSPNKALGESIKNSYQGVFKERAVIDVPKSTFANQNNTWQPSQPPSRMDELRQMANTNPTNIYVNDLPDNSFSTNPTNFIGVTYE